MAQPPHPSSARFMTIDGEIGLSEEDGRRLARKFFFGGFAALPFLWFVNCYFFWPVLRHNGDPVIKTYVERSLVLCLISFALLLSWSLSFSIGGRQLLGPVWRDLAVFNIADQLQLMLDFSG
eukprot:TRINITY_DN2423_c1_g1_i1.p2 TRINITY_DN2423_c1_g1~~TRINITY_DN2423_c1_g1_i1.p2  ORF type:complete len:122 (+),score=31.22 TRINITY_DN2423_c1_g1_i1:20-385(+)